MKLPSFDSITKDRTPEETNAALMAYDVLNAHRANSEIIVAYILEECRKINMCASITTSYRKARELGLPIDHNYAMLVEAAEAYIREFKMMHGAKKSAPEEKQDAHT